MNQKIKFIEVALKDVLPNPYREIEEYGLDEHKLESLEKSINTTGFWNNLMARQNAQGALEIAYGHHRIQAAKNALGEDYVHTFAVANIPDYRMLQMMADENKDDWGNSTKHNNLTIHQGRDYLDALLDKYPTWEAIESAGKFTRKELFEWFGDEKSYLRAINEGVGRRILTRFFHWNNADVKYALAQIEPSDKRAAADAKKLANTQAKLDAFNNRKVEPKTEEEEKLTTAQINQAQANRDKLQAQINRAKNYDTNAGKKFEKPVHADTFKKVVTDPSFLKHVPKTEQVKLADKIVRELGNDITASAIERTAIDQFQIVRDKVNPAPPENVEHLFSKQMQTTTQAIGQAISALGGLQRRIDELGVDTIAGFHQKDLAKKLEALELQIVFFYNHFGMEPPVIELDHSTGKYKALPPKQVEVA